jgi:hypothetical protein
MRWLPDVDGPPYGRILNHPRERSDLEPTMSIDTFSTQILHRERIVDLRHEADRERLVRAARLARPRRRTGFRPWWRRLVRQELGTGRPARAA